MFLSESGNTLSIITKSPILHGEVREVSLLGLTISDIALIERDFISLKRIMDNT